MKYYSILRPVSIGTYPREGVTEIYNYDTRTYIEDIDRPAWGWIEYNRALTPEEARSYDLIPEPCGMTIADFETKLEPFFTADQIAFMTDYAREEYTGSPDGTTLSDILEALCIEISDAAFDEEPQGRLEVITGGEVTPAMVERLQQQILVEW